MDKECLVAVAAKLFPQNPAFIQKDRIISYAEYDELIARVALRLTHFLGGAGSRVAVWCRNSPEYLIVAYACWRLGGVVVFFNRRWPAEQVVQVFSDFQCSLLIYDEFIGIAGSYIDDLFGHVGYWDGRKVDFHADSTIIFSSGTTGQPKGVLHTYANHYYSALGSHANIAFEVGDTWLVSLPFYHVGGLALSFRAALFGGALAFDGARQVTHMSLVATQLYRLLAKKSCFGAKAVLVGGSAVPNTLIAEAITQQIPLYLTYGSTEMASQVTTTKRDAKLSNSGRCLPYREVSIRDGEICVRGQTLFKGYVIADQIIPVCDEDGWFHTGDLGKFNDCGCLEVVGRKDNMFISGGENVYPEEIVKQLCRIDGVISAEIDVVADEEFGKRPVAYVKVDKDLSEQEIKSILKSKLADYKIPNKIFVVDS